MGGVGAVVGAVVGVGATWAVVGVDAVAGVVVGRRGALSSR